MSPLNQQAMAMWRSPPDNNDTDSDEKAHGAETSDVEEGDISEVSTVQGGTRLNKLQGQKDAASSKYDKTGSYDDTGSSSRSGSDSEM